MPTSPGSVAAQQAAHAQEIAAYVDRYKKPYLQKLLTQIGRGTGSSILLAGTMHPRLVQVFADWAGSGGRIDIIPTEGDDGQTTATKSLANVNPIKREQARPKSYNLVYAYQTLHPASMADKKKADAHLAWLRNLPAAAGHIVIEEPDYSGYFWVPAAPAADRLFERIKTTLKKDYSSGLKVPDYFKTMGLVPTMLSNSAMLPANSWLGRVKLIARSRELVASGKWSDWPEAKALISEADRELADPNRYVSTPMAIYGYAAVPR